MVNENQELQQYHHSSVLGVLFGMLIGALAGALTMLMLAPQSGKDTRAQIQKRGIELRDRSSAMMDDAMEQVRADGSKIVVGGRQKAEELLQHGQELAAHQLDRVSKAAQAGKKAIESS